MLAIFEPIMQRKSWLTKLILSPLALLYGTGVSIRNTLYNLGLFKSIKFQVPVISVGNLTTGGTGKTPHIEWLIRHLNEFVNVSVLSRGYRRKSKGFLEVQRHFTAEQVGDEPIQIKRKYPQAGVFVCENRLIGIPKLLAQRDETQVILLDDAFQHRSVIPAYNILLTEYEDLFTNDQILPVGNLREWKSAYKRADSIVISKCPLDITEQDKQDVINKIQPLSNQSIFFSRLMYGIPYSYLTAERLGADALRSKSVLLVAGIAKPQYLSDYLHQNVAELDEITFSDHHAITAYEWGQITKTYDQIPGNNKLLICTEKDAVKFAPHKAYLESSGMLLYILPVRVSFIPSDEIFWTHIKQRLLDFKS